MRSQADTLGQRMFQWTQYLVHRLAKALVRSSEGLRLPERGVIAVIAVRRSLDNKP